MAWTLDSAEKLAKAGYIRHRRIFCRRCGHEVWLYALPGNAFRTMLLELATFQPHRQTCPPSKRDSHDRYDSQTLLFKPVPE
jgi:hypothetical protein